MLGAGEAFNLQVAVGGMAKGARAARVQRCGAWAVRCPSYQHRRGSGLICAVASSSEPPCAVHLLTTVARARLQVEMKNREQISESLLTGVKVGAGA